MPIETILFGGAEMPMILRYVDEIARDLGRDILFANLPKSVDHFAIDEDAPNPDRAAAIAFLDQQKIAWQPCAAMFSTSGWIGSVANTAIYIDVPHDPDDEGYKTVCAFFETADGAPRMDNYHLFLLPLTTARGL